MRKAKYFYVYAVINFEQRLAYIGSRGSVKTPLEDYYMGSYDKKSKFTPKKKLILSEHSTRQEAYDAEREWQIKFDVAKSNLFVNKGIHTSSGFSMYGRSLEDEHRQKSIEVLRREVEKQSVRVELKNIHTGKVHEFKSLNEAARELNVSQGQLSQLVKGKIKKTKDWCLSDTDTSCFDESVTLRNGFTGELEVFDSIEQAMKTTGANKRSLLKLLRGQQVSANGYVLPCAENAEITLHTRPVRLMNAFTLEIENFETVTQAANFLGVQVVNVSKVLNGTRPCTKGYVLAPEKEEDFIDLNERLEQAKKLIRQPKEITIYDLVTKETHFFESHVKAARFLGCSPPLIGQLYRGKFKKILGRYVLVPEPDSTDSQ